MTRDELEQIIRDIYNSKNNESLAAGGTSGNQGAATANNSVTYFSLDQKGYGLWCWGGKLNRYIPQGFSFPKCPVKTVCDLFVFGMTTQHIRPFRLFEAATLDSKADKSNFCKANFVYNCIISIALANDKLRGTHDELEKITRMEWDRVFADAFVLLIEQISIVGKTIKKPGEISYVSLYDYCKELYNLYMIDADGESSSIANGNDSVTDEATSEG
jgi:hypothetical protein